MKKDLRCPLGKSSNELVEFRENTNKIHYPQTVPLEGLGRLVYKTVRVLIKGLHVLSLKHNE